MNAVPFTDPVQLWAGQLAAVLTIGFSSLSLSLFHSLRVGDGVQVRGERVLFKNVGREFSFRSDITSVAWPKCYISGRRSGPVP